MKQIAGISYSKTNSKNELLKVHKPKVGYKITTEDNNILTFVMKRFTEMKSARSRIDIDWQTWQQISESKFYPYADGRTRVNVPLFRALQEIFVSEATTRKIEKELEPIGLSDIEVVKVLEEVWNVDWNKNQRDEKMTEAEYKCSTIGTCAYFTGFTTNTRVINDPDDVNDDGTITYTKKLMQEGRIILKTVDIRNVYFDDRVTSFDDCNDEIYIEYITTDELRSEINNPNYQNLEYVGTQTKTDQVYFTWEDRGKLNEGLVEKLHYWNEQDDKYIVIYNRSIIGRNTPSPYAHKKLPIVPRQYGYVADSIYGRGLAEACMQFLDKINRLSEMLFDGISRSNNSIFAMGNGLTFDGNSFSFNNQMLKFNGQLNDSNFREIKGIAPNQSAFSYLQELLKEVAIYIGIDISQVIGQASSTAFETAIKAESSLKRVNVALMNRDYALQKVFTRHLDNLMQFFPYSEAQKIVEVTGKGKVTKKKRKYKNIILEGKQYNEEAGKLIEKPGKFNFEVKPEYIRGQVDISVKTNFNTPTLKSLKQDSMSKFLKDYSLYSQMSMQDPNLAKVLPPDDFIKELAYTYNIDIASIGGFSDSITKEKQKIMDLVKNMSGVGQDKGPLANTGDIPNDPNNPTSPVNNSPTPNLDSKGLPPVSQPTTPNINTLNPADKALI